MKCRNQLFKEIKKACEGLNIVLPEVFIDKESICLKKYKKKMKIETLHQLYEEIQTRNPMEGLYEDLQIPEYVKEEEEWNHLSFQGIKTPGLEKMYNDWIALKLSTDRDEQLLQKKNSIDIKFQNLSK